LSQLIEEGIIFAYEDAMAGSNSASIGIKKGPLNNLFRFLKLSLDFMDLSISK
jgi:hypothetical protein